MSATIKQNPTVNGGSINELATPPTTTPKRKRKSTTMRAARVIDPDVLKIRQEATAKVKELHKSRASAKLLKTILDKRLAQLTDNDKMKLFDMLKQIVTPALISDENHAERHNRLVAAISANNS